jgi:uncharacterized protein (UPF0147 family)
MDGDIAAFNRNLEESYDDSMGLSLDHKLALRGMQKTTYHEWLIDEMQPMMQAGSFEEAEAFFEEQSSLPFISNDLQEVLDNVHGILRSTEILHHADHVMKEGKFDEAITMLEDLQNDDTIPLHGKTAARRMLTRVKEVMKYYE